MKRIAGVLLCGAVLLSAACGVPTEDEPQLVDDTTTRSPAQTRDTATERPAPPTTSSPPSAFTTTPTPPARQEPIGLHDPNLRERSS